MLSKGGREIVSSGGLAISTIIAGTLVGFNNLGGTQFISSGGLASGTIITSAGLGYRFRLWYGHQHLARR